MPTDLTVTDRAREFLAQVLQREAAAYTRMMLGWTLVREVLLSEIDVLRRALEAGAVRPSDIYRFRAYSAFYEAVRLLVTDYITDQHRRTVDLVRWSSERAAHASSFLAEMLSAEIAHSAVISAQMTAPSPQAVAAMWARIHEGEAARRMVTIPDRMMERLEAILIQGLSEGINPRTIAERMVQAADMTVYNAERIARTETMWAYREASLLTWRQDAVVQSWIWLAALDGRTCPVCWAMHGQVFPVEEHFDTHVNCRCTLIPSHLPPDEAREQGIVPLGEDEFARLSPEQQRRILGKSRYELYQQGMPLSDMVKHTDHPIWGGGRAMKSLAEMNVEQFAGARLWYGTPWGHGQFRLPMDEPHRALPSVPDFGGDSEALTEWANRLWPGTEFDLVGLDPSRVGEFAEGLAEFQFRTGAFTAVGDDGLPVVNRILMRDLPPMGPGMPPNIGLFDAWYRTVVFDRWSWSDDPHARAWLTRAVWGKDPNITSVKEVLWHELGHALESGTPSLVGIGGQRMNPVDLARDYVLSLHGSGRIADFSMYAARYPEREAFAEFFGAWFAGRETLPEVDAVFNRELGELWKWMDISSQMTPAQLRRFAEAMRPGPLGGERT